MKFKTITKLFVSLVAFNFFMKLNVPDATECFATRAKYFAPFQFSLPNFWFLKLNSVDANFASFEKKAI